LPLAGAMFSINFVHYLSMNQNLCIMYRLLAVILLTAITHAGFAQSASQVKTEDGLVEGTIEDGVAVFKGIPFAEPPVGELRWKAPQPMKPWTGVKQCKIFGASPMQGEPKPFYSWSEEFLIPKEPISEDCLYINIWTPANSMKSKKPVLVWIYGGGFNSGGGAVPIYDGKALASREIVVVNMNYRVGIFGFFAHPELTKESPHKSSGNYGLMDQMAALQWVKKNIAAFGGDPDRVTIAGQSAGSMSVVSLVASPLASGLFKQAIAQSGSGMLSRNPKPPRQAQLGLSTIENEGLRVAAELGAKSIADLRKISANDLLKNAKYQPFPIIDGYVLTQSIPSTFKQGKENNVDLLTGWNEDEGFVFGPPKNASQFKEGIERDYGTAAKELLENYPATSDAVAAASEMKLSRDIIFGAPNYVLANITSGQGKKVYVYRFTHTVPGTGEYARFKAFHTGEVAYMFDNLAMLHRDWQAVDRELAKSMSSYWVNFVKTGDPNGTGLPTWPRYDNKSKRIIELGDNVTARTLPDVKSLDFIATVLDPEQ
jgi:para-nitrobenzyl esterase